MPELEIDDTALSDLEKAMRDRWGTGVTLPPSAEITPDPTTDPSITPAPSDDDDTGDEGDEDTTDDEDADEGVQPSTPPTPPVTPPATDPLNPPAPQPTDLIDVGGGRHLTRAQLESYLNFEARLRAEPQLMKYIQEYNPQPPVTTPTPPPEVDLDDPNIRFLYEQNKQLQEQLQSIGQGLQAQQQTTLAEREEQLRSLANRAASSFKAEHKLTDEEILKVREVAGRINAIDTYMGGTHPLTGQAVTPDVLAAMDTALTIAYSAMPEFQERRHQQEVQKQLDNKNRKKKLAKVGANSGSVPRTQPPAENKQELRKQFVEEVRGMMFGGSS